MANGYTGLMAPWIGGAAKPGAGQAGYRGFFAFWMGGGSRYSVASDTGPISMAAFWMGGAGDDGASPAVLIDTHDGLKKKRDWGKERRERDDLRKQILEAIDGPEIREAVAEYIEPQKADEAPKPIAQRLDYARLVQDIERLERVRALIVKRQQDEDDDELIMVYH